MNICLYYSRNSKGMNRFGSKVAWIVNSNESMLAALPSSGIWYSDVPCARAAYITHLPYRAAHHTALAHSMNYL